MAESSYKSNRIATYTARGFQGQRNIKLQLSISMNEEAAWSVSILKPSKLFRHHSVLFESLEGDTFCVALFVENEEVELICRNVDLSDHKYHNFTRERLGTTRKSAMNILETAAVVLQQLGDYDYVRNNCQVSIQATVCFHVYKWELHVHVSNTCTLPFS